MELCAPYTCLNPAFAEDIQPANMTFQNAWFGDQKCWIKAFPQTSKPRILKHRADVAPYSDFIGTPIFHNMQSFKQPFQICKKTIDHGNDKIKERNLWNERGDFSLSQRPESRPCLPGKVAFTRKGLPVSRDGILETANNLKDVSVETELIGQNSNKALKKDDTSIYNSQSRQICVDQQLGQRNTPKESLVKLYQATQINPLLAKEQLYNEFSPYSDANTITKTPSLFRNSTKSRMTNSIM